MENFWNCDGCQKETSGKVKYITNYGHLCSDECLEEVIESVIGVKVKVEEVKE